MKKALRLTALAEVLASVFTFSLPAVAGPKLCPPNARAPRPTTAGPAASAGSATALATASAPN
jgi:hypothetical protein